MKPWSRSYVAIAGLSLIVLSNAVALLGVASNRSGEPESVLTLSPREWRGRPGTADSENSGLSMELAWRVVSTNDTSWGWEYVGRAGDPQWLDEAKMASLGFEPRNRKFPERQRSKEVLLVLEQDGPAYAEFMKRVRQQAAEKEADAKAKPSFTEEMRVRAVNDIHERLEREEKTLSRLFVVDAGLDQTALRQRYPDRSRYAIVRGLVRPAFNGDAKDKDTACGYIDSLSNTEVNVPLNWHAALEHRGRKPGASSPQVQIAFGSHLEPWLLDVLPATK